MASVKRLLGHAYRFLIVGRHDSLLLADASGRAVSRCTGLCSYHYLHADTRRYPSAVYSRSNYSRQALATVDKYWAGMPSKLTAEEEGHVVRHIVQRYAYRI